MQLGDYVMPSPVILAPMAGVTDVPFRRICRRLGFGLTIGEMVAADQHLRATEMSERRFQVDSEEPFPVVQILGADPVEMAQAAQWAQTCGARAVDINFGCPARVVCGKACGSAIMRDEALASKIMQAVVEAVDIPVTVKMRTGWDSEHINAVDLALRAQDLGVSAVTIHGRTREQRFSGKARYEVIAQVVDALSIPVVANGDIDSVQKAMDVMQETGAAAVMVGRAVYGNPWLGGAIAAGLCGEPCEEPGRDEICSVVLDHWQEHRLYWGETLGAVRSFRKYARWYLERFGARREDIARLMNEDSIDSVGRALRDFFEK